MRQLKFIVFWKHPNKTCIFSFGYTFWHKLNVVCVFFLSFLLFCLHLIHFLSRFSLSSLSGGLQILQMTTDCCFIAQKTLRTWAASRLPRFVVTSMQRPRTSYLRAAGEAGEIRMSQTLKMVRSFLCSLCWRWWMFYVQNEAYRFWRK